VKNSTKRWFNQIVLPLISLIPALTAKYQSDYGYRKFFTDNHILLSLYAHLSRAEGANDLAAQLSDPTLATAEMVWFEGGSLAASSLSRANASRPYQIWQELFTSLYQKVSPHFKKVHLGGMKGLNEVRLVDGSLFAATSYMLWATYRSTKNKLKGHFFLDLNGLPDKLIVSAGNTSEREVLLKAVLAKVTYVFDRGYNSYHLFAAIAKKEAFFVTRLLSNALYQVLSDQTVSASASRVGVISDQTVELTAEDGAKQQWRLITFQTDQAVIYRYLTNRSDLEALTIVQLYLWRWEIETFFAWLKRHLVFKHWYSENENGVCIQLYAGLLVYLLLRCFAATRGDIKVRTNLVRFIRLHLASPISETQLLAYQLALAASDQLSFCCSFSAPILLN
jgi:hypothetical protein